jgi:cation:H+ antiporter
MLLGPGLRAEAVMADNMLTLLAGLILLLGGGDLLVRGASGLARAIGVSPLIIGLTVVAFGTSAPEMAVNLVAVLEGSGELSFGNIIGSNMANIGLIVAGTALVRPLPIQHSIVTRELPMMLLATATTCVMGMDLLLTGRDASYDAGDGLVLLLLFSVFLYYTGATGRSQRASNGLLAGAREVARTHAAGSATQNGLLLIFGLVALVMGAELTVDGGVGLARSFGISEAVIGLAVVAVGTSLPELAAALVAIGRRQPDLAVGNVVGSNIFNLLMVLGLCATLHPVPVPAGGLTDLGVTGALSLLLLFVATSHSRQIIRMEGAALLMLYLGYLTTRILLA